MFALFSSSKEKPIRKVLPKKTKPNCWQQILFSIPFSVFFYSMDEFRQLSIREFNLWSPVYPKGDRGLGMDQTKQTDGCVGQSEQTRDWVWTRRNRPKIGYGPDERDRCFGIGQTEQTEDWVWTRRNRPMFGYWPDRRLDMDQTKQTDVSVLARPNRPKIGYGPERTDPRLGMGQTKQTEDWIWTRRKKPMFRYWPDRTDRRLGMDQTKQTDVWVLARPNRPKVRYGPDETDRCLGIGQTEQTEDWVWARANRPKIGYGPDETDRCLGIGQTKQTEDWIWTRQNRPMFRYWPDRTDRRLGMDQTKQTDVWLLARPNRPKIGYGPDETDRCLGIGQTEHTQFRYGPDRTDPILVWARRSGATKNLSRLWARSHRTPLSGTQVRLAHTYLGSRTSSLATFAQVTVIDFVTELFKPYFILLSNFKLLNKTYFKFAFFIKTWTLNFFNGQNEDQELNFRLIIKLIYHYCPENLKVIFLRKSEPFEQ